MDACKALRLLRTYSSHVWVVESGSFSSSLPNPKKSQVGLAVWLGVGAGVTCGLGLILFVILLRNRKRRHKDRHEIDVGMEEKLERGTGPRKFKYNIHQSYKTCWRIWGVYKGFLKELNTRVAVKRISRGSKQGTTEYVSEVKIIISLRHRNLVQLMGWCHEKRELLLVYEFMPNGSLDSHLYGNKLLLPWATRYKIVQGLASALLYLHEEWELCVVHRDIKTSNVLLDLNFNAKQGDFGLARLVDHEKGSQTTNLAGTMGYMALDISPIIFVKLTGKASKEADVVSFDVVALEIACGRESINHKLPESQINLVEWVWGLYGMRKHFEASDPKLGSEFVEQEMERLMVVGLWCAHPDNKLRRAFLPVLPAEMPVATYMDPFMARSTYVFESNHSHNSHSSILFGSPLAPSLPRRGLRFKTD
ncbi:Non-specific serine/threonine protein kinase [Bertholletia excelsa]